jgi:hypothetical protein
MKVLAIVAFASLAIAATARAEPAAPAPIRGGEALCASLLEMRRVAESEGRLDFSVVAEVSGSRASLDVTPRVHLGSAYGVGRITFSGHHTINDSTLRRALTLRERAVFDVGKLRRSLERINAIGLTEPLTVADVMVARHADGATADLIIPLRERRRRWWSLSGPIIPGLGTYHASISSRLPAWGRGLFDASTYYVTFNALGLVRPLAAILPRGSRPLAIALERPHLPGQDWLSGFALSPQLSPAATVAHYGRTHASRFIGAVLEEFPIESMLVPITDADQIGASHLVCSPPRSKWRWVRRGARTALDIGLAVILP